MLSTIRHHRPPFAASLFDNSQLPNAVAPAPEMIRLTQNDHLLQKLAATQHGQHAAIPTYKCSISYSITSSVCSRNDSGIKRPRSLDG